MHWDTRQRQSTLSGWLNAGLTVAQAFQDMVTSQSYFQTTQSTIEQYLTAAANDAITVYGASRRGGRRERRRIAKSGRALP